MRSNFRGGSDEKIKKMWLGGRVVVAGLQPSYSQEITFKLLTQVKTFIIRAIINGKKQLRTFLSFIHLFLLFLF